MTSLVAQTVKRLPTIWETWVQSLSRKDLEKEMATHFSVVAWKIRYINVYNCYIFFVLNLL